MKPSRDIADFLRVMAALRTPRTGCPWDLRQDFASIVPFTIEEAYEVADAVERNDLVDLKDELGDLLLQVVFHSRMAEERDLFDFGDVVKAISTKMIRRHPHVFGDAGKLPEAEVNRLWAEIKAQEKAERRSARTAQGLPDDTPVRLLDSVPVALPGLTRAMKLQAKASTVGFDWNDARLVLAKIREEADEIEEALDNSDDAKAVAGEIGDLLFAVVNLARHVNADPEAALRSTNEKFMRRFQYIEEQLSLRGHSLDAASLDEMDTLWNEAKQTERKQTEPK